MSRSRFRRAYPSAAVCSLALAASGCALTSKGDALQIRYFTLEAPLAARPSPTAAPASGAPELRLGRVTSGRHLRERIAYRRAPHEVGYYEERRWTERPEQFVRRELARELFEERGLRRAVTGGAPTLEVEVVAFEEVTLPNHHAVRITLRVVLLDEATVRLEDTVTVERPVRGAGFGAVVDAMSGALDGSVDEVAKLVDGKLRVP